MQLLEALLSEDVDREAKFSSTMEEVGEEGKLKSSAATTSYPPSYQNLKMRSCYVKLENIPNETFLVVQHLMVKKWRSM